MFEKYHTPKAHEKLKVFYHAGANNWQVWSKPRGINWVFINAISGGWGGGGGCSNVAGTARNGGSGGQSAGSVKSLIPAEYLPNELYVYVGKGLDGGGPDANGASTLSGGLNQDSIVSVTPFLSVAANYVAKSGQIAGSFGKTGNTVVAGSSNSAALTAGNLSTGRQLYPMLGLVSGLGISSTGLGGRELTGATGTSITGYGSGAGGAGATSNNNSYNGGSANGYYTVLGGRINGSENAQPPVFEKSISPLFLLVGGAGGASNANGTGGNGSSGIFGGGGGGGGGGITGGYGGNGGDGIVIIYCW